MTEMEIHSANDRMALKPSIVDAIIVGGGFSGLFMLHRLQENGFTVKLFEEGDEIGGTWFWNRYPGACCDVDCLQYSYWFSKELRDSWHWSERHASQEDILKYLNHVADTFDLRKNIRLKTRVVRAIFDENNARWKVETKCGETFISKFIILATGVLTDPNIPSIKGLDTFTGRYFHPSRWPKEEIDFHKRKVAVIGTGPTGVQCIPIIADQAEHLFVFQRTPNFCVPFRNRKLTDEENKWWKDHYEEQREQIRNSRFGYISEGIHDCSASEVTDRECNEVFEKFWQIGGFGFQIAFNDLLTNEESNTRAENFVREKILTSVKDPNIAQLLIPYNHKICTKRLCLGNNYYETFNRENVTLVDIRDSPIDEITPTGVKVNDKLYEVDYIIWATGFVSILSSLLSIDVHGRENIRLAEKWTHGTKNYLGMMVHGFPNLFMATGPGSPSVLGNMISSIQDRVDFISNCLCFTRTNGYDSIEPSVEAEIMWINHLDEIVQKTLFATIVPFYTTKDEQSKPKNFLAYTAGMGAYRKECAQVAEEHYKGFHFSKISRLP